MIHRLYSALRSFKTVTFQEGLNLIVARTASEEKQGYTRNRAGKTSLVELVHFLLGGKAAPRGLFWKPELYHQSFGITVDLDGIPTTVERSAEDHNAIRVIAGNWEDWPVRVAIGVDGTPALSNEAWSSVLGEKVFGLTPKRRGKAGSKTPFEPSFRQLFPYFARRQLTGGFLSPESHDKNQQPGDQQTAVTFLLGLDWSVPVEFQRVRQKEKSLQQLKRVARTGLVDAVVGTTKGLRTKLTVAEDRARRLRADLNDFQVVDEYRALEAEAAALTRRLTEISNESLVDRQLVAQLQESLAGERPPGILDVRAVFDEARVFLSGAVIRRFDEVERFHSSLIANRRAHLRAEIDSAEARLKEREEEQRKLDGRRAQLLRVLQSSGALEQYSAMQAELTKLDVEVESLRARFEAAQQLERKRVELDIERGRLFQRLESDYEEQSEIVKEAILTFERISSSLYKDAGSLSLTASRNGPVLDVVIEGRTSVGISMMQIYCFDMMLMQLCSRRGIGPGFLIHDSHIFDGVDSRQVASALQVGAALAAEHGFQYIVTLNSDKLAAAQLPRSFVEDHLLSVDLNDTPITGGLFGLRVSDTPGPEEAEEPAEVVE